MMLPAMAKAENDMQLLPSAAVKLLNSGGSLPTSQFSRTGPYPIDRDTCLTDLELLNTSTASEMIMPVWILGYQHVPHKAVAEVSKIGNL